MSFTRQSLPQLNLAAFLRRKLTVSFCIFVHVNVYTDPHTHPRSGEEVLISYWSHLRDTPSPRRRREEVAVPVLASRFYFRFIGLKVWIKLIILLLDTNNLYGSFEDDL